MTDDAAEPHGTELPPDSAGPGPAGPPPPPPASPSTEPPAAPAVDTGGPTSPSGPWGAGYDDPPPAGFTSRYGLVRPRQGRYVAGVCVAIGRSTNTDPILWRVLLAVLGFSGGIGILIYLAVWLITPSEGDTASPVEAMLGRGRSGMSPVTVLILGILAAVMFGFIVTDGFRAVLLGAAVLIGGALLLNRNNRDAPPAPPAGMSSPTPPAGMSSPPAPPGHAPPAPGWIGPPAPPGSYPAAGFVPAGGYRPPFAPHGPYAPGGPPPPPPPPRPPRPPRERSRLGTATLSMILVALGLVTLLDLTDTVSTAPSSYFAAVVVTIALGLLVGAWFGRARWLIALGLVAAAALSVSTLAESYDHTDSDSVTWQPTSYDMLADRYESTLGDAVLDLRQIDFTDRETDIDVRVSVGQLRVLLPPDVDVHAEVDARASDTAVFNQRWSGYERPVWTVTDLGGDGPGGGELRLRLQIHVGSLEVTR